MKSKFKPKQIYIDKEALGYETTKRVLEYYKNIPKKIVDHRSFYNLIGEDKGLESIYLTLNRGNFVKKCPGTSGFICCNYYVIDLVENCHLGCSYCFLKTYLRDNVTKIYVNLDKLFEELECLITDKNRLYRIGTGELSDSLALDDPTLFSKELINYFKDKDNALLELKTKTNQITNLLKAKHNGRVVISCSLNPQKIIDEEELNASSLTERLEGLLRVQDVGYQIALHFDPLIYYTGWERGYKEVIDKVFSLIDSKRIAWISIGSLRFVEGMRDLYSPNDSRIFYEEFIDCKDGKKRYFIDIRTRMYKKIISIVKEHDDKLFIYLCMEGKDMWKRIYSFVPRSDVKLDKLFVERQNDIKKTLNKTVN